MLVLLFIGVLLLTYLNGANDNFKGVARTRLLPNQPIAVCDKTAGALAALGRKDIFISGSTYFYDGGRC